MAEHVERTLTCSVCQSEFPFTVEEQEFFESKGFQELGFGIVQIFENTHLGCDEDL